MVYALGESLLDVIIQDLDRVVARPGGAMLNASISLSRAGAEVTLITELGTDQTSRMMIDFLKKQKVRTECITQYEVNKTALALAFLDEHKKPTYTFLKDYPAQRNLVAPPEFQPGDLFLFGSLYALDPDIQEYIKNYQEAARKAGALILYDPNIRQEDKLKGPGINALVEEHICSADVVKGSDEDFEALFGTRNVESVFQQLHQLNAQALVVMTQGREGAAAFWNGQMIHAPAKQVEVVSTIGAGDGFNAGMASFLSRNPRPVSEWDAVYVNNLLGTGIRFASSVCASDENYISSKNPDILHS